MPQPDGKWSLKIRIALWLVKYSHIRLTLVTEDETKHISTSLCLPFPYIKHNTPKVNVVGLIQVHTYKTRTFTMKDTNYANVVYLTCGHSWKAPIPSWSSSLEPPMTRTGQQLLWAFARPPIVCRTPGPDTAKHTPGLLVKYPTKGRKKKIIWGKTSTQNCKATDILSSCIHIVLTP